MLKELSFRAITAIKEMLRKIYELLHMLLRYTINEPLLQF